MANTTKHTKESILKEALKHIEKEELIFASEVIAFVSCGKSKFYELKIHEDEDFKDALVESRLKQKRDLRKKWKKSKHPSTQIALYKLIADKEEHDKLTMTGIKHSGDENKPINIISLGLGKKPKDD